MKYIPFLFLLLIPIQASTEEHSSKDYYDFQASAEEYSLKDYYDSFNYQWAYQWVGISVGKDTIHLDDRSEGFNALTISTGNFPNEGIGYIAYLEYSRFKLLDQTKDLWTIGFEPIWKYKIFYAGLGLSLSDDYTPATGTKWNFSIPIGIRFNLGKEKNMFIDANVRHRSHGSKLGIRKSRDNNGLNILNLQFGVNFKSY